MMKKSSVKTAIGLFYKVQNSGDLPHCRLENGENTEAFSIKGKIIKLHSAIVQAEVSLAPTDCILLYPLNLTGMKNISALFLIEIMPFDFNLIPYAFYWRKREDSYLLL